MRLLPNWVHGDDISAPLRINRHLQVIKQKLEEGPYFQSLIKKHLLGNTHRLNVVMKGDEDYVHRKNQFEESQLLDLSDKLSLEDRNDLSQDQTTLMMYQHEETDLSLIPSLSTDDLKKKVDIYDFHRTTLCGPASSSSSLHTPSLSLLQQPTNGIAYLRGLLHLQSPANPDGIAVPTRLRQYIPLLMEYLCQVDTENHSYVSLERTINRYTGGIATMNFALAGVHDLERHGEVVCLSTHAFDRNIGTMLNLSDEILCHSHFHSEASRERIKTLISNHAAMLSEDLMESPERIGYTHACSTLTSSCGTTEEWEGLSFLRFMNSINTENEAMQQAAEMLGELSANQNQNHAHHTNAGGVVDAVVDDIVPVSIDEVCQNLSELSVLLFGGGLQGMHRFLAHGDANTLDAMTTQLHSKYPTSSAESLSSSSASSSFSSSVSSSSSSPLLKTFVPLPIQVNHVSACVRTVPLLHADSAKIQVAAEILSHKFLLAEIREKGGAYGGGCHTAQGVLAFSSFRDPNCKETLNVFESCNDWLNVAGNVTEDDVQDALLSVFKSLESPQAPGEKGVGQWLTGITDDERQQFRDSLLGVKRADILEAGDKYFHRDVLQGKREGSRAAVTVIGDSANIEPEGNWTIHDVSR